MSELGESNSPDSWGNVYQVYGAIGSALDAYEAFREALKSVRGRVERSENVGDDDASSFEKCVQAFREASKLAAAGIKPLLRDIHRSCANRTVVSFGAGPEASQAEAAVAVTERVAREDWDTKRVLDPESTLQAWGPNRQAMLRIRPELRLEAGRVVLEQERKGADLSRLSDTERRVYAAVLLNGPITEKGLNTILYGSPTKGDARRHAIPMYRHGIFDRTNDGYIVRETGNIVRTDNSLN